MMNRNQIMTLFLFVASIILYGESGNKGGTNKTSIYQSYGPDDSIGFYFRVQLANNCSIHTNIYGLDFERIKKKGGSANVSIRECTQKPQKCVFQSGIIAFSGVPKDKTGSIISGVIFEYDSKTNAKIREMPFSEPLQYDRMVLN